MPGTSLVLPDRKKMMKPSPEAATTTTEKRQQRLLVRDFSELLTCALCQGYMINPATIDNCLHSYCRSCIVQHLRVNINCPRCSAAGGGDNKSLSVVNLKYDAALRSLIYKLVPGLYQRERQRQRHVEAGRTDGELRRTELERVEMENDFFAPADPISLSLEYYTELLREGGKSPSIRYLQCPALLKVHHLKRFLCSKFDLDGDNKRVAIQVIYEDEVLPNDFTLMDVAYCYQWTRLAPMRFMYRILVFPGGTPPAKIEQSDGGSTTVVSAVNKSCLPPPPPLARATSPPALSRAATQLPQPVPVAGKGRKINYNNNNNNNNNNSNNNNNNNNNNHKGETPPMRIATAKKTSPAVAADVAAVGGGGGASRKSSAAKRGSRGEQTSPLAVANDFKSLRSNDMRYSDYTISASSSSSGVAMTTIARKVAKQDEAPPKCDIVVSIPHSQMPPKSAYASADDQFDNVSLAQLKTACKKSQSTPAADNNHSATVAATPAAVTAVTVTCTSASAKKPKNLPKLKIELNNLRAKLTLPAKSRSAEVREEAGSSPGAGGGDGGGKSKSVKHRKHSLDATDVVEHAPTPIADCVDLTTYAKHIGLKPIEVWTPGDSPPSAGEALERPHKYSPSASPMSSSSSSTASSASNGAGPFASQTTPDVDEEAAVSSSSFHKKRKKKHSKDPNGKRRKLHAEISSQSAEERSLKMKVKLTPAHNHHHHHKPHRTGDSSSRKEAKAKEAAAAAAGGMTELNKTLCEESLSINNLMKDSHDDDDKAGAGADASAKGEAVPKAAEPLPPKPPVKDDVVAPLPLSPALPPSLFNTSFPLFPSLSTVAGGTLVPPTTTPTPPTTPTPLTPPPAPVKAASIAAVTPKAAAAPAATNEAAPQSLPKPAAAERTIAKPQQQQQQQHQQKQQQQQQQQQQKPQQQQQQHFVVPNPPRSISSQRHFAAVSSSPGSIASAANRPSAGGLQLKRSASLDEACASASAAAKQQRLEQDRLIRRTAYGAFMGGQLGQMSAALAARHQQEKVLAGGSFEMPYYGLLPDYGKRRALASAPSSSSSSVMVSVPSSISICKISDSSAVPFTAQSSPSSSTSAVTITTRPRTTTAAQQQQLQQQQQQLQQHAAQLGASYHHHLLQHKPSLEIVRITANQSPGDLMPLPLPPLSPPRIASSSSNNNRLMGPPLAVGRSKKTPVGVPNSRSPPLLLTASMAQRGVVSATAYRNSPPALINLRNTVPLIYHASAGDRKKLESRSRPAAANSAAPPANGAAEKSKATPSSPPNLREFRPTSKDGSVDILDLSATKAPEAAAAAPEPAPAATAAGANAAMASINSLEAALTKLKQNISAAKSDALIAKEISDLQNLHLLSESATAREKIAIKAQHHHHHQHHHHFEKPKAPPPPQPAASLMGRQQNASVRNIPNPSALAFRNQATTLLAAPPAAGESASASARLPPTAAATDATQSVATTTTTTAAAATKAAASTTTAAAAAKTTTTTTAAAAKTTTTAAAATTTKTTTAAATAPTTTAATTTTATATSSSSSCARTTKKPPTTIDQVAATLNIRAAAAEASAKAASAEETAVVTSSTSPTTPTAAAAASDGAAKEALPSSTASTASTTSTTSVVAAAEPGNSAAPNANSASNTATPAVRIADAGKGHAAIATTAPSDAAKTAQLAENSNSNGGASLTKKQTNAAQ